MNMLGVLPLELLDMVIEELNSDRDLRSLGLASRRLYWRVVYHQYRTLTFSAKSEFSLNILNTHSFLQSRPPEHALCHLDVVKNLRFVAPFQVIRDNRCSYRTTLSYEINQPNHRQADNLRYHEDYSWDILTQLYPVLSKLQSGALISFWWHLGTCLPSYLLDEDGYIPRYQCNIKDISLRTDADCSYSGSQLGGLKMMKNLRSIRWRWIATSDELSILCECLHENRHQMHLLDLAFGSSIIGGHILTAVHRLSKLHTLSLTNLRFTQFINAAFSISALQLRSLTLRGCSYQMELLQAWSHIRAPIQLEFFEIDFDERGFDGTGAEIVLQFTKCFNSLRHLHILVSNPISVECYLLIARFHPSLECLVFHTRRCLPIELRRSQETLYIPSFHYTHVKDMLINGSIERLGLCLAPSAAKLILEHILTLRIQVLHLRLSGRDYQHNLQENLISEMAGESPDYETLNLPELRSNLLVQHLIQFADWVFGPTGITTLKVLAYGDFSEECHENQQVILMRSDYDDISRHRQRPYNLVAQPAELWKHMADAQETITACPLDILNANGPF